MPKYSNLRDYYKELDNKYKVCASIRRDLDRELEKVKERANGKHESAELEKIAKANYTIKHAEYLQDIKNLEKRFNDDIAEIMGAFQEHLDDFFSVKPADLDDGVIKLLNSGLALRADEYDKLLNQFANNSTMYRLITQKAEERGVTSNKLERAYADKSLEKNLHSQFTSACSLAKRGVLGDDMDVYTWGVGKGLASELILDAGEKSSAYCNISE